MDDASRESWLWWRASPPRANVARLADVVEDQPSDVRWHRPAETEALLALMAPLHRARIAALGASGGGHVGAVYKRMRVDPATGAKVQRAEARFDGFAGCLRTPAGGSSRQTLMFVDGDTVRTRLMSAREAARLMGLGDDYVLPAKYNDAYRLAGDGVAAPVVRFLAAKLLEPLLRGASARRPVRRAG